MSEKKNYEKDFNKELIKRFANIYEFCNKDINKFILLLSKGVDTYEYMDSWERFDETSLPDKGAFYSSLNMEKITEVDYRQANKMFKEFKLKNLGAYHDLYVQSDTLLLADVFENFRNKCIEIYELDPGYFLSALGLAWQACLKKTEVRLELLTDVDMLLMVEKGIRGGICHAIHRYAKAVSSNRCSKLACNLYDKNNYVVHISALKQALNHGLILKKVHRVIQLNQEAWLKEYIDMNTELRKQAKNKFEKDLFKLMNNNFFGKTMENVRKHRDIKLVTTDKKKKPISFRAQLLYIKMVFRKPTSN